MLADQAVWAVSFEVKNEGRRPVELISREGRYGFEVSERDDSGLEIPLAQVFDRRRMISRAGPRPTYHPVAGGASHKGVVKRVVSNPRVGQLVIRGRIHTDQGPLEVPQTVLTVGPQAQV